MDTAIDNLQSGALFIGDTHRLRLGILFVDKCEHLVGILGHEAFEVVVVGAIVPIGNGVDLRGVVLLHPDGIFGEVVAHIVARSVELVFGRKDDNLVVALELAEESAVTYVVESVDILVVPNLLSGQRRCTLALEQNLVDRIAREDVTLRAAALDGEFAEVEVDDSLFEFGLLAEDNLQHLGLAIGVDTHIEYSALGVALGEVILLVACDGTDGATFHHRRSLVAIAIEDIVDGALIASTEYAYVFDSLRIECLVGHLANHIATILEDDDNIVYIGAVADILILLHRVAYAEETALTVDIEFGVHDCHLGLCDGIEGPDFGLALASLAILLLEVLEVGDGKLRKVRQVVLDLLGLLLHRLDVVVGLVEVVAGDADKLQLGELHHILPAHLAAEELFEGLECLVDRIVGLLGRLTLLEHLIYLVLDENPLERGHMPLLLQLIESHLQLLAEQFAGVLRIVAQDVAHTEEAGPLIADDTSIGRDGFLAVGECVECIYGLVDGLACGHVNNEFDGGGCVVIDALNLDFTHLHSLHNRLLDTL